MSIKSLLAENIALSKFPQLLKSECKKKSLFSFKHLNFPALGPNEKGKSYLNKAPRRYYLKQSGIVQENLNTDGGRW